MKASTMFDRLILIRVSASLFILRSMNTRIKGNVSTTRTILRPISMNIRFPVNFLLTFRHSRRNENVNSIIRYLRNRGT